MTAKPDRRTDDKILVDAQELRRLIVAGNCIINLYMKEPTPEDINFLGVLAAWENIIRRIRKSI